MKPVLLRAMWRTDSIWGALILAGMLHALVRAVLFFGKGPALLHPGLDAGAAYSELAGVAMAVLALAAVLAMLTTGALLEFTSTPFTWFTRGFSASVRRDAALLFLVPVLLVLPLALGAGPRGLSGTEGLRPGLVGLPLLGLAVGLVIFDPRRAGALRIASALTLVGTLLGMEHVIATARTWPLALPAIGLVYLSLTLRWSLSRTTQRATLLGGELVLGSGSQHPFAPETWEAAARRGTLRDARWTRGPIDSRCKLLRAIDFERWGWSRGLAPLGRLGPAGLALGLTVLSSVLFLQRAVRPLAETFELFFGLTWNSELLWKQQVGNSGTLHMVVPASLFLAFLTVADRMQPTLRPGHLYALSRRARAEVLWRGGLENWARASASILIVFASTSAVAGAALGLDFGSGPPIWMTTLACCLALLPLLQLSASLRELFPGERLPAWKALGLMILFASCYAGLLLAISANLADLHAFERWVALAVFAGAIPLGQAGLRAGLRRRFARLDLA